MDVKQLKEDVREGRIDGDRLVELIDRSQRQLQEAKQELDRAQQRIKELEQKLGGSPTEKLKESFSVRAEEQRQKARSSKQKRNEGRGQTKVGVRS